MMACCLTTNAQDNLKIVLNSGTVLSGYISSQRPGEQITFKCNSGQFYVDSKDVKAIETAKYKVKDLSEAWLTWARENKALIIENGEQFLKLSNITTRTKTLKKVRILEQGVNVKYLSFDRNEYSLSWDNIKVIKSDIRSSLKLSGINRRYKLRSGLEYEGQYVEEIPGKTLSLYLKNGIVQVFRRDEVLKDIRYKINPNQTLFEQSDLIDIVQLTNGTMYRGIIVERNYTPTDSISNDYLLIQSENGIIQSVQLRDVREYRKEKNSLYRPVTDVLLNNGDFMVNRVLVGLKPVKENNQVIYVQPDSDNAAISFNDTLSNVVIETKLAESNLISQIKLVKANTYQKQQKKRSKKDNSVIYGFTYENLVNDQILPKKVETSINGTTRLEFDALGKGVYAVYFLKEKKLFLLKIG